MVDKHKNTGNTNAVKDDGKPRESYIHARCSREDKARWVRAAQAAGMNLTDWVIKTLNKELT